MSIKAAPRSMSYWPRSIPIDFTSPSQSGRPAAGHMRSDTDGQAEQPQPGVEKRKRSSFPPLHIAKVRDLTPTARYITSQNMRGKEHGREGSRRGAEGRGLDDVINSQQHEAIESAGQKNTHFSSLFPHQSDIPTWSESRA